MRYKLLGNSSLRVAELALGTMTFGEDWGWGASKEESRKIWDCYAEQGGNFIDTSVNYTNGTAESSKRKPSKASCCKATFFSAMATFNARLPGNSKSWLNSKLP